MKKSIFFAILLIGPFFVGCTSMERDPETLDLQGFQPRCTVTAAAGPLGDSPGFSASCN